MRARIQAHSIDVNMSVTSFDLKCTFMKEYQESVQSEIKYTLKVIQIKHECSEYCLILEDSVRNSQTKYKSKGLFD